jgi:hypothetical protein
MLPRPQKEHNQFQTSHPAVSVVQSTATCATSVFVFGHAITTTKQICKVMVYFIPWESIDIAIAITRLWTSALSRTFEQRLDVPCHIILYSIKSIYRYLMLYIKNSWERRRRGSLRFLLHPLLPFTLPPLPSLPRSQPPNPLLLRLMPCPPNPLPRIINRTLTPLKHTNIIQHCSHQSTWNTR